MGKYDASLDSYTDALRLYKTLGASIFIEKTKERLKKLKNRGLKTIEV
jgi:hypothetical protein